MEFINIILSAGKSAVDIALFVVLPIMVISMVLMSILEKVGLMNWLVAKLVPLLRPMGLTGLSVFALLQVSFVSFAAPVATLAIMDKRGVSQRHLASTFAMVLAMGQANASFPLVPLGLDIGWFLLISLFGGLIASIATYYLLCRGLPANDIRPEEDISYRSLDSSTGILAVINAAGGEAFKLAVGVIPMLALALLCIAVIKNVGGFALVEMGLAPLLHALNVSTDIVVPTLTKFVAGGTALLGLLLEMHGSGQIDSHFLNASSGWLIHTLDLSGVAIMMSSGPRLAAVWKQAVIGGAAGIVVRTVLQVALA
ncbi:MULTISPECIES: nucleoside recognition domain-containing protein [unclassified Herbaspirillum]|uniref:nucleoside recognition domain-containing protein n=1 Tax=unclassified Herbaspirillum TaxID=2624150 RepID=UPI000E2F735C|nr:MULTISPECIES: nucleoside recognition domain-containing protein [unclassified Herbaspirillum]RFB70863.1 nucleoside recognition family protein [Herbaspirillum sp. 3R-3a1]TFI08614.1 nucleoside recognition family protein [Herbaspirillum sp. 3R11]TFI15029.1 nucleoside recognition family protein [Herbaspirillum sp. 3R-11]TFI25411.1 nucleoside recognition family protein [Herbaspirillum sp. 3C11]